MIIRIVHAIDRIATDPAARPSLGAGLDRERLANRAARIPGLETLMIGWPATDDAGTAGNGTSLIALAWLDVSSMLTATRSDEAAFLRDRLGLDVEVDRADSYEVMSRTFGALPTPSAILRLVTLRGRLSGDAALFEHLRDIQARLTERGLIASHVARRVVHDEVEAVVMGVWRDQDAVDAATGGSPDRPAYANEIEPWIESATVVTYQGIEIAPRLPMASGPPILVLDGSARVVDLTPAAAATLGRDQADLVGRLISELAGEHQEATAWTTRIDDERRDDTTGRSAWLLPFGGHVLVHWRMRRNVPVAGRHTVLVHREGDGEVGADEIDAAVVEAFPIG